MNTLASIAAPASCTEVRPTASTPAAYTLPAISSGQRRVARAWLALALAALVGAGLFSVLLVLARTPGINAWLPAGDFFRVALVVHVDLSVLVWFVAMAGLLWSLNQRAARSAAAAGVAWAALALAALGAAGMALAAFVGPAAPVMANYIPVLDSTAFRLALGAFGAAGVLLVAQGLARPMPLGPVLDGTGALRFGLNASVVAAAVALLAFGWSIAEVPRALPAQAYYEILFWGGGHALQFTWTLMMLVAWLALTQACGAQVPLSPRVVLLMFAVALAGVFVTPLAYVLHDATSVEHRAVHTWGMRVGGGLAIAPIALAVLLALLRQRSDASKGDRRPTGFTPDAAPRPPRAALDAEQRALRAALLASMLLFVVGGLIGLTIQGSNVKIPAHYHGSIVGVTLALMGLVYHLLPQLGWRAPAGRLAVAQPWLYGVGQLMHIVGLVWSGGYGVQRKVAGSEQVLRSSGEIAGMGLMGLGGLLAIVGGLLFVVVVWRAMRAQS